MVAKRKLDDSLSPIVEKRQKTEEDPEGWSCSKCTFFNSGYLMECETCQHKLDAKDLDAIRQANYNKIILANSEDVFVCKELFECSICLSQVQIGNGIRLRNCLHTFCRECLIATINAAETVEIQCPFVEEEMTRCTEFLHPREIYAILPEEKLRQFLLRDLNFAERQSRDSFHCKKPNCTGWWIVDPVDVNSIGQKDICSPMVNCPVCGSINCYNCRAVHEGKTCAQHQMDELKYASTPEAQKTNETLQDMLNKGLAMHCPQCNAILMKTGGCDGMFCYMCNVEICWATKKLRRGPNGCGCSMLRLCHPNCGGCH